VGIINIDNLLISQAGLRKYLRWATHYACECVPDGMVPSGEFGIVADDGSMRIIVPLVDADGAWSASGISPPFAAEGWMSAATEVN